MKDSECLFCKIIEKAIPSETIFEDELTFAFLDIQQETTGHTLVVLKDHSENILETPEEQLGPLWVSVKKVAGLLKEKLAPAGFTFTINHGRIAGQIIDHLHVHIIPRYDEVSFHRVPATGEGVLRALRDKILGSGVSQ